MPKQSSQSNPRVVITGIGWVTPLGHDIETVWRRLLAGESAIAPTKRFDASTFPTTFAAEVGNREPYDYRDFVGDKPHHQDVSDNTAFALGAAMQAWRSASLDKYDQTGELDHARLGIYLGSGEGALDFDNYAAANLAGWDAQANSGRGEIDARAWAEKALETMSAVCEIEQEPNMPLAHLAMQFEARGPAYNCLTACAASTQAIGEATRILQRGDADLMISGGAHTMIHPLGVTGFNRLTALSNRNDDPATASRPFSLDRDGFVLGEGAGIVILETLEHALARGAEQNILAEVGGYGSSADAYRITDIPDDGHGAVASMHEALEDARLTPADIDYISAHGTGTKENDSTESNSVRTVFKDHAKTTPMSSIKSMLGHLIAAAGGVELIACALAIRDNKLPPTINLNTPDPECDLDYVPNESRDAEVSVCLSNSFGFGGQNDTVIIKRYDK